MKRTSHRVGFALLLAALTLSGCVASAGYRGGYYGAYSSSPGYVARGTYYYDNYGGPYYYGGYGGNYYGTGYWGWNGGSYVWMRQPSYGPRYYQHGYSAPRWYGGYGGGYGGGRSYAPPSTRVPVYGQPGGFGGGGFRGGGGGVAPRVRVH